MMKIHLKKQISLLFFFLLLGAITSSCHRNSGASNPYLHMKRKPVETMKESDNRALRKAKRAYKREMLNNRKHLFGRKRAPKD